MNIVKSVLKLILGFIVMISLLGMIVSWEVNHTILNKEFMLRKMEENNYYENVYSDVINEMKGYIAPSGLDEKVLNDIITTEKIKNDIHKIIANLYENKEEKIETIEIVDKLDANIENFLQEENLKVNNKESIEEFKEKIVEEYEKGICYNIYTKYSKSVPFAEIQATLKKIEMIGLFTTTISLVGFVLLNLKNAHEIMCFVLASGMIICSSVIFITISLKIDYIMVLNDSVSIMIRDIAKNILKDMSYMGGILIILSLFVMILGNIRKSKWNNQKE